MTQDEVIARLSKENMELKDKVSDIEGGMNAILGELVCIGGPINDNFYNYNRDQLKIFFKIRDICKSYV